MLRNVIGAHELGPPIPDALDRIGPLRESAREQSGAIASCVPAGA